MSSALTARSCFSLAISPSTSFRPGIIAASSKPRLFVLVPLVPLLPFVLASIAAAALPCTDAQSKQHNMLSATSCNLLFVYSSGKNGW
eukprot:12610-Heterococcus_DN1.PRE.1